MQRFTISLDDELARQFGQFTTARGYSNRSEAVRDLIREQLGGRPSPGPAGKWCVATLAYVYDHHEHLVAERVTGLHHAHHDLVVSTLRVQLDHDDCMETAVLRGPTAAVQTFAQQLIALRGVRHGKLHLVALARETQGHRHPHSAAAHTHLTPLT